jgi:hypothetical protein
MSQNLKAFMYEAGPMTPGEVLNNLAQQVPGRSIGDQYVISARINKQKDLELELDDGSVYAFTCRSVS